MINKTPVSVSALLVLVLGVCGWNSGKESARSNTARARTTPEP